MKFSCSFLCLHSFAKFGLAAPCAKKVFHNYLPPLRPSDPCGVLLRHQAATAIITRLSAPAAPAASHFFGGTPGFVGTGAGGGGGLGSGTVNFSCRGGSMAGPLPTA